MSASPEELSAFARKFLDLWQEQLATALRDPELVSAAASMMQQWPSQFYAAQEAQSNPKKSNPKESASPYWPNPRCR